MIKNPNSFFFCSLKMGFRFRAAEVKDSVLIYSAQSEDGQGDFVSVSIRNGHLEFRFDTGSGPAILKSPEEVERNKWYNVILSRKLKSGTLMIAGMEAVKGESPGSTRGLNIRTPLYLGGINRKTEKALALKRRTA